MSTFTCPVVKIKLEPHPNANKIEIAKVGEYQSIVQKGQYQDGEAVIYIPEQAIVPENVLDFVGLKDKLSGKYKNRVKAVRLRGVVSQGLIVPIDAVNLNGPLREHPFVGDDVKEILGVIKYEPPIPNELRGEVFAKADYAFKFDVENFKKFPHVFEEGERVTITEKLHGTFCFYGKIINPRDYDEDAIQDKYLVGSKGQIARGRFFKNDVDNAYTRVVKTTQEWILNVLNQLEYDFQGQPIKMVFVVGEVLGVQGGFTYGQETFRAFGAGLVLEDGKKGFLDFRTMKDILENHHIPVVPVLYEGQFWKDSLKSLSCGKETVSGKEEHIREGVVIYPYNETHHPDIGRKILKYVGDDYLGVETGEEFE